MSGWKSRIARPWRSPAASSVAKIQATVDGYPGVTRDVQTYLQERMKEVLTGASGSIVVRVSGPDLATLRAKAEDIPFQLFDRTGLDPAELIALRDRLSSLVTDMETAES